MDAGLTGKPGTEAKARQRLKRGRRPQDVRVQLTAVCTDMSLCVQSQGDTMSFDVFGFDDCVL